MKPDNMHAFYDLTACQKHEPCLENSICLDKSVMECDMSEIVVCCKENVCRVKDICIDMGVPVQDKFLCENGVGDKNSDKLKSKPLNNGTDEVERQLNNHGGVKCDSNDLTENEETQDDDSPAKISESDESKSSTENYAGQFDSEHLTVTRECDNTTKDSDVLMSDVSEASTDNYSCKDTSFQRDSEDKTADNFSKQALTLGDIFLMENNYASLNNSSCGCKEKYSQNLNGNRSSENPALVSAVVDSNNCIQEELSVMRPDLLSASEKWNIDAAGEKGIEDKNATLVNISSVSTSQESTKSSNSDLETGAVSSSGKNEDPKQPGSKNLGTKQPDPENLGTKPNHVFEDFNDQTFSNRFQSGESSFSAIGPVSGLITYSGPVAYSGSLSFRSDSSTTSARSFAFPVLQSEWNSSPVRMAKADRRHLQRHKGWIETLFCCRF